ncbi:MAG: imelysin family protein [Rhizobiaceae bacterium]
MKLTSATLILALFAGIHPAQASNAVASHAIDGFVRPAYAAFHATTGSLRDDMASLCNTPGELSRSSAQAGFIKTVEAWARVENIRFGPVTEHNRHDRILFWPDRRSIGLKQVQAALAEEDETAAEPGSLSGKSVAMQGLGALEFVLFGTGSDELTSKENGYRCRYGLAIASNLDAIAGEIEAEWRAPNGIASLWANPGSDNPLYRDDTEAVTEVFNVFVHGLEMIRDVRFNGFLGDTAEEDKPKLAIFWRSGATAASIRADLAGLANLYDATTLSASLSDDQKWIADSIRFEFANADGALRTVEEPIDSVLKDPAKRKKLDYARLVTSSLSDLFGDRLAGALGLTAGFSSLDGD